VEPEETPRCPNCGWQDVRRSHARGSIEKLLSSLSIYRFRCRSCNQRFFSLQRRRAS